MSDPHSRSDVSSPAADALVTEPRQRWPAITVLATIAVGVVLYLGQSIWVPLALAALLAFVLDPLVVALRRWGLPRGAAVALVMVATVGLLGSTALFVNGQLAVLAKELPAYQSTVQAKVRALRKDLSQPGPFSGVSRMLDAVGGEINAARREVVGDKGRPPPLRVAVEPAQRPALQELVDLVGPLLGPLGTAGAVLLFLVFVLLERHDMRDRLLRLAGGNLHLGTDALGEAAHRVSRYLTMQLAVNLSYGIPLAVGLWLIGVPGALLWGLLGALLRFIPYLGAVLAALFPLALAIAVDPGWQMMLWVLLLVVVLEAVVNNVIEPWLYGISTGLSPLAVVVSAMFWTLLWGPVGLVLATPLTVCFAVLGRHLPQLAWLDVLLGSEPAFDRPTRLYQRLLGGAVEEAIELCEEQIRHDGLLACYSTTAVPALAHAAREHQRLASVEHRHRISTGMATLIASLREDHPAGVAATAPAAPRVLCVGARSELDNLAAEMLAHALDHAGLPARVVPAASVGTERIHQLELGDIDVLCVSSFGSASEAQLRFIARRARRRRPQLRIVLGLWALGGEPLALEEPAPAAPDPDAVARTLAEGVAHVRHLLEGLAGARRAGQGLLRDAAPGDAAPGDALPGDVVLGDALLVDALPGDALPGAELPGDALLGGALLGGARTAGGDARRQSPPALAQALDAGGAAGLAAPPGSATTRGRTDAAPEAARLAALHACGALDPACQPLVDRAALRAADIFGTPIAIVNLIGQDRALWQGTCGLEDELAQAGREHARSSQLCDVVVATRQPLVIDDAERDPAWRVHPMRSLLPLRFYAGVPLVAAGRQVVGSLCLVDSVPRALAPRELRLLAGLADALVLELAFAAASRPVAPGAAAGFAAGSAPGSASLAAATVAAAASDVAPQPVPPPIESGPGTAPHSADASAVPAGLAPQLQPPWSGATPA